MTTMQGLRGLFAIMLLFGALNLGRQQNSGPLTRAFDYTLFALGSIGSITMWAMGLGKFDFAEAPNCPECGTKMPLTRKPANRRQLLWGGWTCKNCGTEMDGRGRKIQVEE